MVQNKGLIFKESVKEWPEEGKHLVVEAREFDLNQEPPEGGITMKVSIRCSKPAQGLATDRRI